MSRALAAAHRQAAPSAAPITPAPVPAPGEQDLESYVPGPESFHALRTRPDHAHVGVPPGPLLAAGSMAMQADGGRRIGPQVDAVAQLVGQPRPATPDLLGRGMQQPGKQRADSAVVGDHNVHAVRSSPAPPHTLACAVFDRVAGDRGCGQHHIVASLVRQPRPGTEPGQHGAGSHRGQVRARHHRRRTRCPQLNRSSDRVVPTPPAMWVAASDVVGRPGAG